MEFPSLAAASLKVVILAGALLPCFLNLAASSKVVTLGGALDGPL